jgi:glyoxylase I family protein
MDETGRVATMRGLRLGAEVCVFEAVHHVAIIATDYPRSRAFYVDQLGFTIVAETFRAERQSWKCDLRSGSIGIELFSFPDPPRRPSRPEAAGLRHLAFTVADLDASVALLQGRGITVEPVRIDALTGKSFTFFADPDGLPLELYEA